MSDYTPSTEEVREYVMLGGEQNPWLPVDGAKDAARAESFNRWLASERARIWAEGAAHVLEAYAIPGDPSDANPYKDGAA